MKEVVDKVCSCLGGSVQLRKTCHGYGLVKHQSNKSQRIWSQPVLLSADAASGSKGALVVHALQDHRNEASTITPPGHSNGRNAIAARVTSRLRTGTVISWVRDRPYFEARCRQRVSSRPYPPCGVSQPLLPLRNAKRPTSRVRSTCKSRSFTRGIGAEKQRRPSCSLYCIGDSSLQPYLVREMIHSTSLKQSESQQDQIECLLQVT